MTKLRKNFIVILVFFAVISINLFFGIPRIKKFTAVDETRWSYDRVPKFWRSIKKANWKSTSLCDKPGITLAAISGLGLPFIPNPQPFEKIISQPKTPEQINTINNIYLSLRLPVYLFALFSLPVFYFLIKRLWGQQAALISVIFIGLSPILLGISLIVNTDAILWILMPLAIISFLIYQKEDNKKFLWLSGFIFGLALLDKYVANLLFPFFFALIFLKYIFTDYADSQQESNYFKRAFQDYFILIFISFATIIIFYPAIWVKPKEFLNITIYSLAFKKTWPMVTGLMAAVLMDTFLLKSFMARNICIGLKIFRGALVKIISLVALGLIGYVFLNIFQDMRYADFENLFFTPKPDIEFLTEFKLSLLSAFYPLIFGLTPIVSALFMIALIILVAAGKIQGKKHLLDAFALFAFILVFYLASSLAQISATVRYQIVAYPIAGILAAIGLTELIRLKRIKKYFSGYQFYALIVLIILASFFSLKSIRPFFFSYTSHWLPEKFILNPRDMGDGSYEASEYLNSLPDAENLVIWTDKKQVCEKFIGKCKTSVDDKVSYDYFVTSTGGKIFAPTVGKKKGTLLEAWEKETGNYRIGTHLINPDKLYSESDFFEFKVEIGHKPRNFIKVMSASLVAP